ncbi:MAG TPA: adenylate/guanylate cyclase domain-containing protein [Baekduia sp.]|nr:adenylate/guanylate cyclase domain-containing protein [Baekduia sp.]
MIGTVQWARNGDANVAYRIIGDGPVDLVFLGGLISHVEVMLDEPGVRRWFERLGAIARTVLIDRRGAGLSDPLPDNWSVEQEAEDLLAVIDDAGLERVVIFTYGAGTPGGVEFAASHPDRTLAMILYAPIVRGISRDRGLPMSNSQDTDSWARSTLTSWGDGTSLGELAPSAKRVPRQQAWMERMERLSMTPAGLPRILARMRDLDVSARLLEVQAPVIVMYRRDDPFADLWHSREVAESLDDVRLVELPGVDSLPMIGETEAMLAEIEEFLTGKRTAVDSDRALLTIVITDVVASTSRLARIGDSRWRDLLTAHDEAVRREVDRFDGRVVKTVGDSFLIAFDSLPSIAVEAARQIVAATRALNVDVRVGIHTGECELIDADVGGMAVHIASRIGDLAGPGEVLVSPTTFGTSVGTDLEFEERGQYDLKGVPFAWPLFVLLP